MYVSLTKTCFLNRSYWPVTVLVTHQKKSFFVIPPLVPPAGQGGTFH